MDRRSAIVSLFLGLSFCSPSVARAAGPIQIFDHALVRDSEGYAHLAYLSYLRAAEAGLPEAEFNVAVMLDSGRGVTQDITKAALFYARAAAHGNHRAAFNLGLLYEAGQGVPKNSDIARAWFAASDLPSGRARLAAPRETASAAKALQPPQLVAPAPHTTTDPRLGGVEFVWTSRQQREPVSFVVELRALGSSGPRNVFSRSVDTSSLFATPRHLGGPYAWRVLAVTRKGARRARASAWIEFKVARN